jgi:beta-glucosidase
MFTLSETTQAQTDYTAKAKNMVSQMTLEEKALLLSGNGWWQTHAIDRLNIPAIFMTDGPHGLRKSTGAGLSKSVPATCFPTASALASSWNTALLRQVGEALGRECQANDVQIILGPGVNMKRSPLGGRNFEYFSEDPHLAGSLAVHYINGVQSQGVGTSLKHFAVNSQEYERMANSSNVDERTLYEIYLPAFEMAVREAQPWTIMSAYNSVNGTYASENPLLLQKILREQWGFKGFVVSDWGGINDRIPSILAGNHLEMPGSGAYNRNKIIEGVNNGLIPPAKLDEIVTEFLAVVLKAKDSHRTNATLDKVAQHTLARKVAGESIVLLKNEQNLLPINPKVKKIAVIGAFAKSPRYQGAGSSQVNPTQISNALEELQKILGKKVSLSYAQGYDDEGATTPQLTAEAVQIAQGAELVLVFAGLPDSYESEGFDRSGLDMPSGHNTLIEAISKVNQKTAVILMNGSVIAMPWANNVQGIVEAWLGGQAGGGAIADVLTGKVNPSGKLAETFPIRLADTPTPEFPGLNGQANYKEGIFIGYRHYDKQKIKPLFPFGFGLSYTTFTYANIEGSASGIKDTETLTIQAKIKNTGKLAGQEIVQLYVQETKPKVERPDKELKGFSKIALQAGEEKTVSFQLSKRDFAYYDANTHSWQVNAGKFKIFVGASSQDLPLVYEVEMQVASAYPKLTEYSTLKEFRDHPKGKAIYPQLIQAIGFSAPISTKTELSPEELKAKKKSDLMLLIFANELPIKKLIPISEGKFTEQMLADILKAVE